MTGISSVAVKLGVLLIGILALSGCELNSTPHQAILGKWRSNEQLTLESIVVTEGITPQTREFLEGDFFGHLEIEIRETVSRTTIQRDNYDSGFEPYQVVEVSDDFIRIRAWSNFFQNYDVRTLYLDGECYYEIFVEFNFREYFCPSG